MNDKTDQKTEQTPIEQPDAKPAEAPIELTVSDLSNLKQIIDVASSRGAFKPNEMTVVGTRPEFIRLSRVIAKLDEYCEHTLVHTGQNYDYELNQVFFEDLEIR